MSRTRSRDISIARRAGKHAYRDGKKAEGPFKSPAMQRAFLCAWLDAMIDEHIIIKRALAPHPTRPDRPGGDARE